MSASATQVALVAFAASLWAAPASAGLCVDVDLQFGGPPPPAELVTTLKQETTAIWAAYGVELHWQPDACRIEDASFDIQVERRPSSSMTDRPVLGMTHVQLRHTSEIPIMIEAAAIEHVLDMLPVSDMMHLLGRARIGPEEIGRAFGRVVAHEIGHVLLGLPNHQRLGLMRRSFRPLDMVAFSREQYTLSPAEVVRLRHRSAVIVSQRGRSDSTGFLEVALTADSPLVASESMCGVDADVPDATTPRGHPQGPSQDFGARPGSSFKQ